MITIIKEYHIYIYIYIYISWNVTDILGLTHNKRDPIKVLINKKTHCGVGTMVTECARVTLKYSVTAVLPS